MSRRQSTSEGGRFPRIGTEAVSRYDVYAGNGDRGRIARVYSFTAADDMAAEEFVTARLTHEPVELWCHSRRVARFEGKQR